MKRKERFFGILLSLALMLGLMAGMSLSAHAETTYDVWVGGVQVTSANRDNVLAGDPINNGRVSFAPATETTPATLTLNGATITSGSYKSAAIYAGGNLTIDVTADSTVAGPEADNSYGVYVRNAMLTVIGAGTLTAEGGTATLYSYGVRAFGDVTVNGTLTGTGGAVTGEYGASCGVCTYGDVIVNGTLTAAGGTATNGSSYGVSANDAVLVEEGGTLTAAGDTQAIDGKVKNAVAGNGWTDAAGTGGKANIDVSADARLLPNYRNRKVQFPALYDVWVGGVRITGANMNNVLGDGKVSYTPATNYTEATLTLSGATITSGSYRSAAIYAEGDLTINVTVDSTVTGPEADDSYGVYVRNGHLTVTGSGELTAEGGTATGNGGSSCGVLASGSVTVNGTLTAAGGEAPYSYGVRESGSVTVNGKLTAEGSSTNISSFGVFAEHGAVTVAEGGTLTGTGGAVTGEYGASFGVWAYGDVTVNGALTAEGGEANTSSYGVSVDSLTVTATGTLTAAGGAATIGDSIGVLARYGAVTVAEGGTLTAAGGTATNGNSCGVEADSVTVEEGGTLTAAGDTQAIYGSVKNAIAGTGWTNAAGTEGMANIAINTDPGQNLSQYRKVQFPARYAVWVGGVQVTGANMNDVLGTVDGDGATVTYTPAATGENPTPATLTLSGATITSGSYRSAAIYVEGDLTIDVTADSIVTGPEADYSYGVINSSGSLTVTGSGKLTAEGSTATGNNGSSYGVFVFDGSVTVAEGGTLTAAGGEAGAMSFGVSALSGDVTVAEGGELTATGSTSKEAYSSGVYVSGGAVTVNGKLTAEGGTATNHSLGVSADSVTVNGTLTAAGGTSTHNVSWGVLTSETVTVNGTLIASGGTATNGASYGVSAIKGVIVDTGAKLTATGDTRAIDGSVKNAIAGTGWTNAAGTEGMANIAANDQGQTLNNYKKVRFPGIVLYPVWVGGVQVTELNMADVLGTVDGDGATVTYTPAATGENPTPATLTLSGAEITSGSYNYAAIYAEGDLTINVTADSTVTGPEADDSFGVINSGGSLTVTGAGTLTAEGSTATTGDSIGVYLYNGAVTVNGKLTAEGGTATLHSLGVLADSVTVNGTLTGTGGKATNNASYGVLANGAVTVAKGGKLTAAGDTQAIAGRVKNAIAGTGWTNTAGTEGMANIPVNTDGQTLEYRKVLFPELPAATLTTAPTAKTLKYTGQGQELVNAGAADGGTMYYAIGTASEATGDYAAAIPIATATGTYYVWYKVKGDDNHNDTEPAPVTVRIGERSLTITAAGASKTFDGTALTKNGYFTTGLAEGDKITSIKVTGSITSAGSAPNTASDAVIKNSAGEDVTDKYEITYPKSRFLSRRTTKPRYTTMTPPPIPN